jgi:HJR/Mrr/RecB family endonuclease
MLIREIIARFRNLEISVTIDQQLLPNPDCVDNVSTQRNISFNLYKLIYAIGTIQTRRFAPSNRQKFIDKSDLIEMLYSDTIEFRVKLNEIRQIGGQEVLKSVSEDFGVGISVVIAENLFNIKYSTIQRVYGKDKRPDWECQTSDNRTLIVESKGSSSQTTSNAQQAKALIQKNRRIGDIKIASLTVINENQISRNRCLDPPITSDNMDFEMKNNILRAGHYSSVFSFLGHSILSRYYSQMRNRLLKSITPDEQDEKNNIYFKLRDIYPIINFNNRTFTGSFYKIGEELYLFIGIDKKLISYEGFLEFIDYENEIDETINKNHYILFKDGILIIEIRQIREFSNIVKPEQIKNYQENITITDVDAMTEISFEKYVNYLLIQNGFETIRQQRLEDFRVDIIGIRNNKKYIFELKLFKKKKIDRQIIEQLTQLSQLGDIHKIVLITNAEISEEFDSYNKKIILIGRNLLRTTLKNKKKLNEILDK